MKLEDMICAVQTSLGVRVDGCAGPETWGAIYAEIVSPKIGNAIPAQAFDRVDDHSEKCIATLLPEVRFIARALVQKAAQNGITIKIVSGLRSYAEQDALYAKGRTIAGAKVTNAKGGHSNHNFGIAFDIGVFEGNRYRSQSAKYKAVGVLGMDLGLEWGGNWTTIRDQPHFQLRPHWARGSTQRQMLAQLRRRLSSGDPIYA